MIGADGGDVDIFVSVVVVVGDSATHSVHFDGQASLARNVGEGAVVVVVVERGERVAGLFPGLLPRPVHGVDQQNVLPSVVVVVEKADAAAHGFGKIFFAEGAAVVFEVDSGLRGYVGELDRGARRRGSCW